MVPQGLKPRSFFGYGGAAKAAPFQNARFNARNLKDDCRSLSKSRRL
jgi:hypothetical protein